MPRKHLVAAILAAGWLLTAPVALQAQKALVYCPVGIDATGCNLIMTALRADTALFPGGVDGGYDGSQGTVDLATADLATYAVFVVPSLADGPGTQPYGLIRNATISARLKGAFVGRAAVWSGTPDVGSTNRSAKDGLIRNLGRWARPDSAGTHGPGLVVLQDNSDDAANRYSWLVGISSLALTADTAFEVYSNVQVLTATGRTILTNSGGLQIGYTNMASYGLIRGTDASGATDEALGGRTSHVVLVTAAGEPSDPNIATVRTDKEDYQPGDTVTVTGAGWEPGETVSLLFHEDLDPPAHPDKTLSAVADSLGHIFNHEYGIDEADEGVRFTLTATGETSGRTAQATFTDATHLRDITVLGSQTTNPVTAGNSTTYGTTAATSVQVRFNGNGSCTATLAAVGLPSGATATFTPSTVTGIATESKFSLLTVNTTAATPAGSTTFTVSATGTGGGTNDCGTGESVTTPGLGANPVLVVTAGNQPPVLAAIPNKTVDELTTLSFTATATDPNSPPQTLTFSLDAGFPTGATINATTGAFSWTPTEAQGPGDYSVTVRVTDSGTPALSDTKTFSIHVNEVNVAPVLGTIGNKTVNELSTLTFTATATDADLPANTLTFSLVGAPAGASINASTGTFSWTPTEAQGPGDYTFTVKVTDNGTPALSDDETITVHVNEVNAAPVLTGVPSNLTTNELVAVGFDADATDGDAPAQTLTFSLVGAPSGATINGSTGVFAWTPSEAQGPGGYTFQVAVSDGIATTQASITITVNEVNLAPELAAIGNKSVDEGTALTFTATATDADLPANTLSYSLTGTVPAGAAINSSSGVFTWTPTEAQGPGSYTFTVKVADNGTPSLSDEETITVTVNEVNQAPVVAAVPDKTVDELQLLTFTASATDADLPANGITFSLVGAPSGATIDGTTGAFSWTPTEAQGPGVYTFQVRATDDGTPAAFGETTVKVTVNEVNVAPVLAAIGNKTVDEETALSFSATATDADLPANTLTFSLVGPPAGASITSGGAFTWTPTEAQGPGSYTFTVKVTDNGTPALSDEESITVTVNEVNKPPVVAPIADQTVDELTLLSFTASATDPDVPANSFTFSLVGAPAGASINATTGAFSWTPSEAQGPGVYTFQVRATDDGSPSAFGETTVKVTVNEVNVAPELAAIGNKTVDEETALTFTASATDADLPANTLSYSLTGTVPAGASINASTGAFSWTPTEAQGPGSYTFTVKVTDNGTPALSDEETITVTVNEVNQPPVVAPIADQTVDEETLLTFTATATDPDIPANSVAFSLVGAPIGTSIDPSTGAFSWTPTEAQGPGVYTFQVRATDNGSPVLFGETTVKVTVKEVNRAPTLNAIGNKTADEEAELTFTASATDPDIPANTLAYSLIGAPAGASINGSSGVFSWTPTEAQGPGDYTFTVKVTDDGTPALSDEEEITVHVNEVNVAPVLASIGNQTVDEETTLSFTASATDHDIPANTLAFSLDAGAPAGASIDPVTGAFSWTPDEADGPGDYPVTIRVKDNGTPVLDDFETITIHVNEVNKAPTLNAIGNKTVDEETALTFTATATDPDLPPNTLTFSLVGAPAGATISTGGAFSWTPTEAQGPGDYTFTVKVTDNGIPALSDEETITVHVNEVNKAPVFTAIPDQTVDELTTLTFTASATDPDIPANAVTYSLAAGPNPVPAGASINPTTGGFTWTPTEAQGPGTYTFKVVATDDGTPVLSGETTVKIAVNEVNMAPVLAAIGNKTVDEETLLTFNASATDADLPPNGLTFSLVGAPAGASIDGSSGVFSWTPSEAQGPGSYTFTVRVTDDGTPALSDEETITVTVNEVNVAPVLAAIGNKSVDEETALSFTATATDHDLPANTLAFSLDAGAPVGAAINPVTGAFTWTPTEAQGPGSYPVTIRVKDNGTPALDDFETITIAVNEVNKPPVLAAIGNKTVNEETALSFMATATDPDLPANSLTFSLVGAPAGASITAGGAFSWTPTEAQGPGDYTFTVKVTDNGTPTLSDDETITVHVNEVNKNPVVNPIAAMTVNEASTVTFTATATDPDLPANTLTFSLVGGPATATINPATGAFSWTPADDDPTNTPSDVYTFKVRATDNGTPSLYGETTVTITVNNVVPVLAALSGPLNPTAVGTLAAVSASFTDVGTKDIHTGVIDWGDGTTSATIVESNGSGTASGSHSYSSAGVYTVKLTVADDDKGNSNQSMYQYVVVYDPNAGFVTGGGWIDSPAGAYRPDPSLTGKANFGFVAKYQKGKSVPDGNTEFQFKAGNLNFQSSVYEWLVISGAKGQYKGYGTINGAGNYRFVLTIEDGDLKGTGIDKFRIRIWGDGSDLGGSGVVYDSQYGADPLGDATTVLGGGSVVIHSDTKTASK
jgi:hypothetical protein